MFRFVSILVLLAGCATPVLRTEPGSAFVPWYKVNLVSQDSERVSFNKLRHHYLLVNFIYTRCPMPNMCPLTMSLSKRLIKLWKRTLNNRTLKIVNVTLDPNYDTPAVMSRFGQKHGVRFSEFMFWTGERSNLEKIASEFNIIGIPGGGGLIAHNIKSILLTPGLKEIAQFTENEWSPEDVVAKILPKTPLSD